MRNQSCNCWSVARSNKRLWQSLGPGTEIASRFNSKEESITQGLTGFQRVFDLPLFRHQRIDKRFSPLQFSSGDGERSLTQTRLEIRDVAGKSFERLGNVRGETHVSGGITRGAIAVRNLS